MKQSLPSAAPLVLIAVTLLACETAEVEPPEPIIRPVRYQEVYSTGGTRIRTFSGVAKAGVETTLSFKVAGTIDRIGLKVGDLVEEGQFVAELDPRDYELFVEDTEASLAQARAMAVKAEADFKRIRGLFERDNASQADYDAARAAQDSERAQVRSTQKKLDSAKLKLSYTKLASPVSGAVAAVPAEVHENVQTGSPIVNLLSGKGPEVEVGIPEVLIAEIRDNARVKVVFDALPGREFSGLVTEISVASTQGLTTYPVTIALNRTWEQLARGRLAEIRPGMAAEVSFNFGHAGGPDRWVIPPHSVAEDREGRFVFVVRRTDDGLGSVERRSVTVGEFVRDGLEIVEGLEDGDLVVTAGVSRISAGQEVKLVRPGTGGPSI